MIRLGRFILFERLGAGGMGVVWKAWDTQLERWVALKRLKGSGEEDLARFEREARMAARLSHPNIAAIHEVGEEKGEPFIAMQLLDGQPLNRVSGLEGRTLVRLIRDVARALDHAHVRGVVHRDLKPSNLVVAWRAGADAPSAPAGPEPHIYVLDFGIARPLDGGKPVTSSGMAVGSPGYMSPEQWRGEASDARSDIYSLGATLYSLLCGTPPGPGSIEWETPDGVPPRVDADLRAILRTCLEQERHLRYPSARALADDLDRYLDGAPVRARRAGPIYPIRKWVRRHRAGVLTLAVAAALAVLGIHQLLRPRAEPELGPQLASLLHVLRTAQAPPVAGEPPLEIEFDLVKEAGLSWARVEEGGELVDSGGVPGHGDNYKVLFGASGPCFVYVVQADSTGKVSRLFPGHYSTRANPVSPGATYEVPEQGQWLYLDENRGVEHVFLFASRGRNSEMEAWIAGLDAPGAPGSDGRRVTRPAIVTRGVMGSREGRAQEARPLREAPVPFVPTVFQGTGEGVIVLTRSFRHRGPDPPP